MAADGAKITLHWLSSSRAQATLTLLEELGVPYELNILHRLPSGLAPPEAEKLHPLGKFPMLTITPPGDQNAQPLVLAESAFIVQYLTEHFGQNKTLAPPRWKPGQEGQIGGETESWMRYQYLLYYGEGSFMPTVVLKFIMDQLKGPNVPFFIRPLTRMIANGMTAQFIFPNMKRHFGLLEGYLATAPDGGGYLCGPHLTGADIMVIYPLVAGVESEAFEQAGAWEKGSFRETFPKLHAYILRLAQEPAWQRSLEKIKAIEGKCDLLP